MSAIDVISNVVGWIYFAAWSLSFYGQLYENWRLKSVEGYKLDFQVLNMTGFTFYAYINTVGYFWEDTNPYQNYGLGTVQLQDFLFAAHAIIIVMITGVQCLIYPRGKNKVSTAAWGMIATLWFLAFLFFILFKTNAIQSSEYFNFLILLGIFKLCISTVKYTPPAYWNYKRKSTVGWSIINVLLDFTGGFFSVLQTILDVEAGRNISMVFDTLFMVQHYLLYPKARIGNKIYGDANQVGDESAKISASDDLYLSGPLNRTYE